MASGAEISKRFVISRTRAFFADRRARTPLLLELGTVAVVVVLALAFARPLLEEWGLTLQWRHLGPWHYWTQAQVHILRPLEPVPSWLNAQLGGTTLSLACGFAILLVAKYLAARWAVAPVLGRQGQWVVATMATVLLAWPGEWRMRFSPAQFSMVFFLLALGAVVRARDRWRWRWFALGAGGVLLMLLSYQALLVCAAALPLVALFATAGPVARSRGELARVLGRTAAPVAVGFALYAIYAEIAKASQHGASYEEAIYNSGGALRTLGGLRDALADLYRTTYLESTTTLALFAGFTLLLAGPALLAPASRRALVQRLAVPATALAALPLLGGAYVFNLGHRIDPDRVMFPVSVGFLLLAVVMLVRHRSESATRPSWVWAGSVVAVLLISTGLDARLRYRDYEALDSVATATANAAERTHATRVVLRDYSGTLGDLYRLYPPTLSLVLAVRDVPVKAELCIPDGVDRIHPAARRSGEESTPRCEELPPDDKAVLLDARPVGGRLQVSVAGAP